MTNPIDIFNEENKKFFAEMKQYEINYSSTDEDGSLIRAIMPHKGYNFSASYDAIERAMNRYAKMKVDEYRNKAEQ